MRTQDDVLPGKECDVGTAIGDSLFFSTFAATFDSLTLNHFQVTCVKLGEVLSQAAYMLLYKRYFLSFHIIKFQELHVNI